MKIKDKKGIRDTFKALPELKEVHIRENGDHYFNKAHAEAAAEDGEEIETLTADAEELKAAKKEKEAPKDEA